MSPTLVDIANNNYRSAFADMTEHIDGGAVKSFGSVLVTTTGTPLAAFNRVFVFSEPTAAAFDEAMQWFGDRGDPFWVTATAATVDEVRSLAETYDLAEVTTQPGMAIESPETIEADEPSISISLATDTDDLEDAVEVFAPVFDIGRQHAARSHPPSYLSAERLDVFVGRADDRPVACGVSYRDDMAAGVYSIGVIEAFRRRGIGRAMTAEVLRYGAAKGSRYGVLQSSEMGYPLYETMGFETVETYTHFGTSDT